MGLLDEDGNALLAMVPGPLLAVVDEILRMRSHDLQRYRRELAELDQRISAFPLLKGDKGDPGEKGDRGVPGPAGRGGAAASDFSVNDVAVNGPYTDGSVVLHAGSRTNPVGAFKGTGIGNKAIWGQFGYDKLPLGSLTSFSYTWTRIVGDGGPFSVPPGPAAPNKQTPYPNVIVDFTPGVPGGLRVLVFLDDGLNPAITAAIGSYSNAANVLTYAWDSSKDVLIVGQAPPAPGGVLPHVSVGPSWLDKSYRFSDLTAANPDAVLVDRYPADNGYPAATVMPAIVLCVGDSTNVTSCGYQIAALSINGTVIVP